MQLALRRAGPDGAHADQVGQELRGYRVQHLAGDAHAPVRDVDVELAAHAEALVDFEGAVEVGVVDEALPADGRAGLFEVGAHDDVEGGRVLGLKGEEAVGVVEGRGGGVDGAGADYY